MPRRRWKSSRAFLAVAHGSWRVARGLRGVRERDRGARPPWGRTVPRLEAECLAGRVRVDSPSVRGAVASGAGARVATSRSPGRQAWPRYAIAPPSPLHLLRFPARACSTDVHSSSTANSEIHFIGDFSLSSADATRMVRSGRQENRPEPRFHVTRMTRSVSGFPHRVPASTDLVLHGLWH